MQIDDLRLLADEGGFLSLDIEGDGGIPLKPVEICFVEFSGGLQVAVHYWLINPGRPMSDFVQGFHGITDAMVEDKPGFAEIEPEVRKLLSGQVVLAHRAEDDLAMLRAVMPDVDFVPGAVLDTQRMARNLLPGLHRYRLDNVRAALGIDVPKPGDGRRWGLHTAETDAVIAGRVFLKLAGMVPQTAKARRHFSRTSQVVMSPRTEARRREELAAMGIEFDHPGARP